MSDGQHTARMSLIKNITDAEYQALEGVNFSYFKNFFVSPYHYLWCKNNPEKETDDLLVGNAIHCAVLQPETWEHKFVVAPKLDRRKTEDKIAWNIFVEASKGKVVLTDEQFNLVLQCSSAIKDNKYFKSLVSEGDEIIIESAGNCEFAGSMIKGRIDLYNVTKNIIFDIKSCKDMPTLSQMKKYAEHRLHYMQGFFYSEIVMKRYNLKSRPSVVFGYVHKKAPFTIGLSQFGNKFMDKAARQLEDALCRFENCKLNSSFPDAVTSTSPAVIEPYGLDTDHSIDEVE